MGQPESKTEPQQDCPFYPNDLEIKKICSLTDLDKDELHSYYYHVWVTAVKENGKVDYENFLKYFYKNIKVTQGKVLMKYSNW